jgi:hypothetical protein
VCWIGNQQHRVEPKTQLVYSRSDTNTTKKKKNHHHTN